MIVTSEAVVLRTMNYRETSRIAVLLTRDEGKVSVIAKGARDRRSRLGAPLQVMNHVTAVFYMKQSRELQLLSQCDLVRPFRRLTRDLARMAPAMAAVELIDAVTPPEEPNDALFALLTRTLDVIDSATKNPENALYYFEMHLLDNIGFRPDLHRCCKCLRPVIRAEDLRGAHMGPNGVFCADCSAKGHGLEPLSGAALRVLQRFQELGDSETVTRMTLSTQVRSEIGLVLRRFLVGHVEGLRTLKSESVFSSLH